MPKLMLSLEFHTKQTKNTMTESEEQNVII